MSSMRVVALALATACCLSTVLTIPLKESVQQLDILLEQRDNRRDYDVDLIWKYFETIEFKNNTAVKRAISTLEQAFHSSPCTEATLDAIRDIGSLVTWDGVGFKRINELIGRFSAEAVKKCVETLDDLVENQVEDDKELGPKLAFLHEGELYAYDWVRLIFNMHIDRRSLATQLRQVASDHPLNVYAGVRHNYTSGEDEVIELMYNLSYIYRQFLLLPCKRYMQMYGRLVQLLISMGKLSKTEHESDYQSALADYLDLRSTTIQDVVFRAMYCRNLQAFSTSVQVDVMKILFAEDKAKVQELLSGHPTGLS